MLGGRPLGFIARNAVRRENYLALWRMARVYPDFLDNARRYFSGGGSYPYRPEVRTPTGVVAPTLYTSHDLLTLNEVFCRLDYAASPDVDVVVDIGANIGISALYFLTRNRTSRCYLFEPVEENVTRLGANLAAFEDRWELAEAAVWDRAGAVTFGVEPTGRYGGIDVLAPRTVEVSCLDVNDVLEAVLEREPVIDVLKIDTEGAEIATVAAIREDLLKRIKVIYFETTERPELHPGGFDRAFACDTCRLTNRGFAAAQSSVRA